MIACYIRRWLEIPICGTLRDVFLTKTNLGLNIYPPSTGLNCRSKFVQCQTVSQNVLKSSPNKDIQTLWKSTSISTNCQYDSCKDTKQVLKAFRSNQEDRLKSHLVSQGSFFSSVTSHLCQNLNSSRLLPSQICRKIYSISLSDTSIMHFLLDKISQNGAFLPPLIIVFA